MTKPRNDRSGEETPATRFVRGFRSKLAGDAGTLFVAHVLGLVVPFITVPYLARVLRPEGFGLLIFAQSFGLWLALVIEFGFDLSGTRGISRRSCSPRGGGSRDPECEDRGLPAYHTGCCHNLLCGAPVP